MNRRVTIAVLVVGVTMVPGCFIDPGTGGTLDYHGDFQTTNTSFSMSGNLSFSGGNPTQDSWEDINLVLYDSSCEELRRENLGTLDNSSDDIHISMSLSEIPEYVVISSPDVWSGETAVEYFERNRAGQQGYEVHVISDRSDLPC